MSKTPFYTGGSGSERAPAEQVAKRLDPQNPTLRGFIYSAAAYLIRDGQPPTDSRVLAEARRRQRYQKTCIERIAQPSKEAQS